MRPAVSRASVAIGVLLMFFLCLYCLIGTGHVYRGQGDTVSRCPTCPMHVATLDTKSKSHAKRPPCTLCAGQRWRYWASPASGDIRLALLWARRPWGRASLRLREPYHCDTPCMSTAIARRIVGITDSET